MADEMNADNQTPASPADGDQTEHAAMDHPDLTAEAARTADIEDDTAHVVAQLMEERSDPAVHIPGQMLLAVLLIAWFTFTAIEAADFPDVAVWFPRAVSIVAVILNVILLIRLIRLVIKVRAHVAEVAEDADVTLEVERGWTRIRHAATNMAIRAARSWFTWTLVLIALLVQFGTLIGLVLWAPATYLFRSKASIRLTVLTCFGIFAVLWTLTEFIGMRLP